MSTFREECDLVERKSLLDVESEAPIRRRSRKSSSWKWTALNIVLFLTSVSLSIQRLYQDRMASKNALLKENSFFSPVLQTIDIKSLVKETQGELFEPKHPSKFRNARAPDPDVNAAWEAFETIRVFPITSEQVRKLGKDPELTVKFPQEYGLGDDAHVAQLDVFHQIHCLNLLRHLAWAEYGRNESVGKPPYSELHYIHVAHCTDILMQNLMCTGNLDVLTFNWAETQELPFPDFNVKHQCRDFDAIVDWQEQNSVPADKGRNFSRPAGAKQVPISEEYYKLFGLKHEHGHVELHER